MCFVDIFIALSKPDLIAEGSSAYVRPLAIGGAFVNTVPPVSTSPNGEKLKQWSGSLAKSSNADRLMPFRIGGYNFISGLSPLNYLGA